MESLARSQTLARPSVTRQRWRWSPAPRRCTVRRALDGSGLGSDTGVPEGPLDQAPRRGHGALGHEPELAWHPLAYCLTLFGSAAAPPAPGPGATRPPKCRTSGPMPIGPLCDRAGLVVFYMRVQGVAVERPVLKHHPGHGSEPTENAATAWILSVIVECCSAGSSRRNRGRTPGRPPVARPARLELAPR